MKIDKNITTLFMLPTLRIPKATLKENMFVGAFSIDGHKYHQYENAIYLLFKPTDLTNFKSFVENEYLRTVSIIDDYDYDGGYVVLVYTLESSYKRDFNLIIKGKYSETSKEFQSIFDEKVEIRKEGVRVKEYSIQYKIFNKTSDLREYWENSFGSKLPPKTEIWSIYDIFKETLKL